MIKTEFEYEGFTVVAYASSADSFDVYDLFIKFLDEEGERVYPRFNEKTRNEIEEQASELLRDVEYERELNLS